MRLIWPTMASVSPSEWSPQHVVQWMSGLDDVISPYIPCFLSRAVTGRHLLMLAADDLPAFGINKLGHQDLILEAIDLLRHFHYCLDTENLQSLALQLSCKARSLYNDLKSSSPPEDGKQERVTTPVLSNVANILVSVKTLVSWLDRDPFKDQEQYTVIRNLLLHLSVELATNATRDRFAETPIDVIKSCCLRIAELCENVIQESRDSLIIQPASVEVATVKKKPDEELGLFIHSSYSGIHIIGKVKLQSPAFLCENIGVGDEVLQVNYQNVVGWQLKKLVHIMKENPTEIILTLKKRPRHSNVLNQTVTRSFVYQKKSTLSYVPRFQCQRDISISPPFDLFSTPSSQPEDSPKELPEVEEEEEDDSAFLPEGSSSNNSFIHLYLTRPRATVQRRATVTGASPNSPRAPTGVDQLWIQVKRDQVMRSISHDPGKLSPDQESVDSQLRKKVEDSPIKEHHLMQEMPETPRLSPRPNTCIGADPLTEAKVRDQRELPNENKELCQIKKDPVIDTNVVENQVKQTEIAPSEEMSDLDNALKGLRDSLKSLADKDHKTKASSLPRNLTPLKCNLSTAKPETSSNPDLSASSDSAQSYQVIIAGGVAQVGSPKIKDDSTSPTESPVLRRKGRAWEFASRRVSCKDLGMGDCQGWLYKRKDQARLLSSLKWTKRWCILKNHNFYCYVDKDDLKAESLMYLPAFNVSPAVEIKSKKFAFKVYHSGSSFYFASDSQQDMSKWMNKMGLAAIAYDASEAITTSGFVRHEPNLGVENVYYSETENDSEDGTATQISDAMSVSSQDTESLFSTVNSNTLPKYTNKTSSEDAAHPLTTTTSEVNLNKPEAKSRNQRTSSLTGRSQVKPTSPNISSLSLKSVRVSSMSSVHSIKEKDTPPITKRVHVGRHGWVSFEKRINKVRSKLASSSSLAPAFEMNLDSPQKEANLAPMNARLEPKSQSILQKLGLSPRCEKKKKSTKNTRWFDKDSEGGSSSTVSSEDALESTPKRKLVSSASQTDIHFKSRFQTNTLPYPHVKKQQPRRATTWDTRTTFSPGKTSWQMVPIGRERVHYRTQMTVQIGKSSESSDENSDAIRSPRKPAMGVAMIGKHRRSSTVSEKSLSDTSVMGVITSVTTATQSTQTESDDDWDQLFSTLYSAHLTIDGTDVGLRRAQAMLTPCVDKRRSQQLLLLRSLQRTLKAKELDLEVIEQILSEDVTAEKLNEWMANHPHLCQVQDQSSSDVVESD